MRALTVLAVVAAALLAGCGGGKSDPYFPKASSLPEGWSYAYGPQADDGAEFKSTAKEVRVAGLAGPSASTGSIVVVEFDTAARAAAVATADACDGKDVYHVLRDGDTVVFLGIGQTTATAKAAMDDVADAITRRSGADRAC